MNRQTEGPPHTGPVRAWFPGLLITWPKNLCNINARPILNRTMAGNRRSIVAQEKIMQETAPRSIQSTVLICDIRGFTKLMADAGPEESFKFVRQFLQNLTSSVIEEGGNINNLTGDGFLAQFGSGVEDDSHALRAVNCAIEMRNRLKEFNRNRHSAKVATVTVGIGLHSGMIAGGYVQLGGYRSFLIIGDTINITARIESLTKDFAVDILLSEQTFDLVKDQFNLMSMPLRVVKGKTEKLKTFWLPPQVKPKRTYSTGGVS